MDNLDMNNLMETINTEEANDELGKDNQYESLNPWDEKETFLLGSSIKQLPSLKRMRSVKAQAKSRSFDIPKKHSIKLGIYAPIVCNFDQQKNIGVKFPSIKDSKQERKCKKIPTKLLFAKYKLTKNKYLRSQLNQSYNKVPDNRPKKHYILSVLK